MKIPKNRRFNESSPFSNNFFEHFLQFSAANCFKAKNKDKVRPPQYISALVGKHNLSITDEPGSVEHLVWDIILHPEWNFEVESYDADICVVVLRDPVKFSRSVKPICLPQPSELKVVETGTVVGWGKSEDSERHATTLNELEVPAVSQEICLLNIPDLFFSHQIELSAPVL